MFADLGGTTVAARKLWKPKRPTCLELRVREGRVREGDRRGAKQEQRCSSLFSPKISLFFIQNHAFLFKAHCSLGMSHPSVAGLARRPRRADALPAACRRQICHPFFGGFAATPSPVSADGLSTIEA
jgi:hypothetical protein